MIPLKTKRLDLVLHSRGLENVRREESIFSIVQTFELAAFEASKAAINGLGRVRPVAESVSRRAEDSRKVVAQQQRRRFHSGERQLRDR